MKNKKGLLAEASAKTGSGLIFAVVLLFVILGMVITLASVTMLETKMNQKNKSSVGAFYSSESGVEWALNKIANSSGDSAISTLGSCPFAGCSVLFLGGDGKVLTSSALVDQVKSVRSVGTQGGETQRAIEAAVAATGGGCYVSYEKPPIANREVSPNDNCAIGFISKGTIGDWGACILSGPADAYTFRPPSGGCGGRGTLTFGTGYLCCQN